MYNHTRLIIEHKTYITAVLLCFLCMLPASGDNIESNERSNCEQPQSSVNLDIKDPNQSDDPVWQESGGFSLYAVPVKSKYAFGEDIVVKLRLKNETGNDLKYLVSDPLNIYYLSVTDSLGKNIPEVFVFRSGSYGLDRLRANQSKDHNICINRMFTFPSPGIYTARAWRDVTSFDGNTTVKLYSNKFVFEIYGDPKKAKRNILTKAEAELKYKKDNSVTMNSSHKTK